MHPPKHKWKLKSLAGAALCASLLSLVAPQVAAQGCAMCYQTAAASGAPGREALRQGILILLLPAVCVFLGVFVLIYRRNKLSR
ncbi:MAG TPA: hypothetical protein VIH46_07040 [Candidatus Acidoferrales bacterium]